MDKQKIEDMHGEDIQLKTSMTIVEELQEVIKLDIEYLLRTMYGLEFYDIKFREVDHEP